MILASIMSKIKGWLLLALAILGILVGAYTFGSRKAKQAADLNFERRRADDATRVTNEIIENVESHNETTQEVSSMSDADAYSELRDKWTRKNKDSYPEG